MAYLCRRCSFRLQRATESSTTTATRAFSSAASRRKQQGVPSFTSTSNPELDDVLASMRKYHFIPGYLSENERRMIFRMKHKSFLEENPQTIRIGSEDIELEWLDRVKLPNRSGLLNKALKLMREGEKEDWNNLPSLLTGLNKLRAIPDKVDLERIIRLAVVSGQMRVVLKCLQQVESTGLTLKLDAVLNQVIWGLHTDAQESGWSKEATANALKSAQEVATHLENEHHGTGSILGPDDPRGRPRVLGVFLELAAVYAHQHQDGKDVDGKVRVYADRLLSNINETEKPNPVPPTTGPVYEMQHSLPIWHGLYLAQKVLGQDMPKDQKAKAILQNYESSLESLAQTLEAQDPAEGTYADAAVMAWTSCIRE